MGTETPGSIIEGQDVRKQVERLRSDFPEFYNCIDPRLPGSWEKELEKSGPEKDDFGLEETGGRGSSYIHAQVLNHKY